MSYGIYIGRNHSAHGHAWLAGYGDEPSSHWLEIVDRKDHPKDAAITVGMTPDADLPGQLSTIPQTLRTARHLRVSYSYYLGAPAPLTNGGLNEYGVAVRDIWSPSRPELIEMTPSNQTGPNYSDLARIVLERARTAREGVDIIAGLIANHGYSCYGGNSHIIADADEAWVVIECSGGLGLWVAERLGPDSIRASRPGYIGDIPLEPDKDFRFPAHFISTAIEKGWYKEGTSAFNVNMVYGDGKGRWAGVEWIEEEMRKRAAQPEKITFSDIAWAIRTEKLTGDTAGYGQVVPLNTPEHSSLRVIWHAPVGPVTAPLIPVFMGQSDIPAEYGPHRYLTAGESGRFIDRQNGDFMNKQISTVPQCKEIIKSAFQIQKQLMHLVFRSGESTMKEVVAHWRAMEDRLERELPDIIIMATILIAAERQDLAQKVLNNFSSTKLLLALQDAESLVAAYNVRLRSEARPPETESLIVPKQIW